MPVGVVDLLEVVYIQEQARQRVALTLRAAYLFAQALLQITSIVRAGKRIGQTDVFEALIVDYVLERDGDDGCQALDEIGCHAGNETVFRPAGDVETADQPLLPYQRQDGNATCRLGWLRKKRGMLPDAEPA